MKCERCGWDFARPHNIPEPKLPGWKLPPLPPYKPHPIGLCPSPFAIGDTVYWNLAGRDDDLPPIRGRFSCLTAFVGPEYDLNNGVWREKMRPIPSKGVFEIDGSSVSAQHINLLGSQLQEEWRCFPVDLEDIVPAAHWPTVLCE
jgi:hypothetical protein